MMISESDIREPFASLWKGKDCFACVSALEGQVFRAVKNRRTLRFERDGRGYFVKVHGPTAWSEILKNYVQFKQPVLGAENEYHAIRKLEELGIPTMRIRAYAAKGSKPAHLHSFLITDEILDHISLEDFCRDWAENPPPSALRHKLIRCLAQTCAKMHGAGINHRDCYLCHFLLDQKKWQADGCVSLCVLDLHRAGIRRRVPHHLLVKDLAGIFFSSMDLGLSAHDINRFLAVYNRIFPQPPAVWKAVARTALRLYRKDFHKDPPPIRK